MSHIVLTVDGQVVYEVGATTPAPTPTPTPVPTPVPTPPQPPARPTAGTQYLGDLQKSPHDNEIPNMVANVVYSKRMVLDGLTGWVEMLTGGMANFPLTYFSCWVSVVPGGVAIARARGCELQRLSGENVGTANVNIEQLASPVEKGGFGLTEVYFNVQAEGPTGRYMQRNP